MNYIERIKEIARKSNGIITPKDLKKDNIPRVYLSRLVQAGELERIDRGVYINASGYPDAYYIFQKRFKVPIFSYVNALYLHGLTDIIPYEFEVTVYTGYNSHRLPKDSRVHYVDKEIYELGVIECETNCGYKVKTYDLERTICDLIKDRSKIDTEIFSKAMQGYIKSDKKNLKRLEQYAIKMKIIDKVVEVIQLLL